MLDLKKYLARIQYAGELRVDVDTLCSLQLCHLLAIPFENLSTLIGDPVPLDLDALQAKLVASRRGGYCFEQNNLFKAVLEVLGFDITPLAARVVWGEEAGVVNPRTHMVLRAKLGAEVYLCDVGFGGTSPTAPLLFVPELEQETPHESFRLMTHAEEEFELQVQLDNAWKPMYQFDTQPQLPIDYEVTNHYVATHPSSHFRSDLRVARPTAEGRSALNNREFTRYRTGKSKQSQLLTSSGAIRDVLESEFEIELPVDARLDAALQRIASLP